VADRLSVRSAVAAGSGGESENALAFHGMSCRVTAIMCLAFSAVACTSSDPPAATYNAVITTDDDETRVELVRLIDGGGSSVRVESLDSFQLDYGGMPFLVGQGWVPPTEIDVPPRCLGSQTLGIADAVPCLVEPLLRRLDSVTGDLGLDRQNVVLTAVFNTGSDEVYTEELIGLLAQEAATCAVTAGYESQITPTEEPAAPEALP
jgi:hypothetical protein